MPTGSNDSQGQQQLTRSPFVMMPLALVEQCAERKGTLFVYAWLWHYAGRDDAAWPSLDRLALECRMKRDDIRQSLKWLCSEGWVTRSDRPGATSVFHVRTEHPSPKRGTPPPDGGTPKRGMTPLPQMGDDTPPPKGATNNTKRTRLQEQDQTPCSPPPPPTPAPAAVAAPTDTTDHQPAPKRTRSPRTVFRPTAADVPLDLQQATDAILTFWPDKRGSRSQAAWALLLAELSRIARDPAGGMAVVIEQLGNATQAGWQSVTFANWQRYARPAALRVGTVSGSGYRSAAERQADRIDEAVSHIWATDPMLADHPRNPFRQRTTTPPMATIDVDYRHA